MKSNLNKYLFLIIFCCIFCGIPSWFYIKSRLDVIEYYGFWNAFLSLFEFTSCLFFAICLHFAKK